MIWAFLLFLPFDAFADSPTVEIKSTVDQVIQILTNPQLQGEGRKQERRKRLREVIFVRFTVEVTDELDVRLTGSAEPLKSRRSL